MRRSRTGAVVLCAAMTILILVPGSAAAAGSPHIPQSMAEWEAMSPPEQAAVTDYLEDKLQTQLADGTAQVREVSSSVTFTVPASEAMGAETLDTTAAVTVTYNCYVQWVIFPGEGDWVRGGGWTDASDYIDYIYASRSGKKGQFLRDGELKENWYQAKWNAAHAERWTGYHWAFWFEYVHWVTKGWHGAQDNGSWLLGPDRYCYAEKWL